MKATKFLIFCFKISGNYGLTHTQKKLNWSFSFSRWTVIRDKDIFAYDRSVCINIQTLVSSFYPGSEEQHRKTATKFSNMSTEYFSSDCILRSILNRWSCPCLHVSQFQARAESNLGDFSYSTSHSNGNISLSSLTRTQYEGGGGWQDVLKKLMRVVIFIFQNQIPESYLPHPPQSTRSKTASDHDLVACVCLF